MTIRAIQIAILCTLVLSERATAQQDPFALWTTVRDNFEQNKLKVENYTYTDDQTLVSYYTKDRKKGKPSQLDTKKWEVVFVDGMTYARLVDHNGKPLEGEEAKQEEENYRRTVMERRRSDSDQKKRHEREYGLFFLPPTAPQRLFTATLQDVEDNPKLAKLTLTPRRDANPLTPEDRIFLCTSMQFWIDKTDEFPIREHVDYVADETGYILDPAAISPTRVLKGSTRDFYWQKIPDGVYVPIQALEITSSSLMTQGGEQNIKWQTEALLHDYKKFSTDARIIPETEKVLPGSTPK
jgi:hypothetical protein